MNDDISEKFFKRMQRKDRAASRFIVLGGIGIVAIVVGMLFIIASVALPLFHKPKTSELASFKLPSADVRAVGIGEYLEIAYYIAADGTVVFIATEDGQEFKREAVAAPGGGMPALRAVESVGFQRYAYLWDNGAAAVVKPTFTVSFDADGKRVIDSRVMVQARWYPEDDPPLRSLLQAGESGQFRVDLRAGGGLRARKTTREEDFLGNVTTDTSEGTLMPDIEGVITEWALDLDGRFLYAGTDKGQLVRFDVSKPESIRMMDRINAAGPDAITGLSIVLGEISVAVGDDRGRMSTWMPVRKNPDAEQKELARIHGLRAHPEPVTGIIASRRNKTIISASEGGTLHGDYMTSERALFEFDAGGPVTRFAFAKRGNGLIALNAQGGVHLWSVDSPHPEVSWNTLFGKVWYESRDEAEYVWQSSSASDDFEPKLSLVPLIHGTLKGTLYAMLFAAPLAIMGALYTSQFMRAEWRNRVKPAVEIMAAVPSVVVGFLGGLWLAPLLEDKIPGVFLFILVLPLVMMVYMVLYRRVRKYPAIGRLESGYEFIGLIPFVILATWLAFMCGEIVESTAFGGDFKQWLYDWIELRVDQRNCIVIAFALGFTVIPVIFTLADDALMAVPKNLTAASLALGASRWQTAWSVVLPSASPGIFAALMIGLGRAVGETMIVLMATGNTPIMEWSMFNGMRTLSANIAVEIPEAPHNGTLYRVLFLSAVLLFFFTFVVNSAAEMVRIRLRKKFGNY